MVSVSKTGVPQGTVGSNPTLSATHHIECLASPELYIWCRAENISRNTIGILRYSSVGFSQMVFLTETVLLRYNLQVYYE